MARKPPRKTRRPAVRDRKRIPQEPAGQVGWNQVTDEGLIIAGLDVASRHRVIRRTIAQVEAVLEGPQRARLEDASRTWAMFCAAQILRALTQGGKRTWKEDRAGKPGLLQLLGELEAPRVLLKRSIPDAIWAAQRHALAVQQAFTVDVRARDLKGCQGAFLPASTPEARHAGESWDLNVRIAQVYRFYGVGSPVRMQGNSVRAWRFYPWRMARVEHQLEVYGNVRLASLDWLPSGHFTAFLQAKKR